MAESMSEFYGYIPRPIDVDRGVTIAGLPNGVGTVVMYDDMPGLFLNPNGTETTDERAREAGYDVDKLRREARLRQRLAAAERDIREQFSNEERRLRAEIESEAIEEAASGPFEIPVSSLSSEKLTDDEERFITKRNAQGEPQATAHYTMEHQGAGFWVIVDERGDAMTERIRGRAAAARAAIELEQMRGQDDEDEPGEQD